MNYEHYLQAYTDARNGKSAAIIVDGHRINSAEIALGVHDGMAGRTPDTSWSVAARAAHLNTSKEPTP